MKNIIEDAKNKRVSGGVFSVLNNDWLQQPVAKDIPEIDKEAFDEAFNEWEDKYLSLMENVSIEGIDDFVDSIYAYRQEGLNNGGEFSIQNLVFKEFRNLGYIDTLKEIKTELTQKELSLESKDNKSSSSSNNINEEMNEENTFELNTKEKQYYIDFQDDDDVVNDLTRTINNRWFITTDPKYDMYGELNEEGWDYILVIGKEPYDALTGSFVNDMFIECGTYDEFLSNMEDEEDCLYCSLDKSKEMCHNMLEESINKQNTVELFNKLDAKLNVNYAVLSSSVDGRPINDVNRYDDAVIEIEKGIRVEGMWTDPKTHISYPQPYSYILQVDIDKAKQLSKDLCQKEFIEFHFDKEDKVVSQVYATTNPVTYDDYEKSGKPSEKVVIGNDALKLDYYSKIDDLPFSFGLYGNESLQIFKNLTEIKEK